MARNARSELQDRPFGKYNRLGGGGQGGRPLGTGGGGGGNAPRNGPGGRQPGNRKNVGRLPKTTMQKQRQAPMTGRRFESKQKSVINPSAPRPQQGGGGGAGAPQNGPGGTQPKTAQQEAIARRFQNRYEKRSAGKTAEQQARIKGRMDIRQAKREKAAAGGRLKQDPNQRKPGDMRHQGPGSGGAPAGPTPGGPGTPTGPVNPGMGNRRRRPGDRPYGGGGAR